jgi:hypothetical protein
MSTLRSRKRTQSLIIASQCSHAPFFQSTLDFSDKPNYRFSTTLLNRNYPGPNRVAYLDFKPFSPNIA